MWDRIDLELYGNSQCAEVGNILDFVQEYNILEKYLVFKDLRYTITDTSRPLLYYLDRMNKSIVETINLQLLVSADAGTVFEYDGIRYYMHSREAGRHNMPHVHVDIRHDVFGTFSLIDDSMLDGDDIKGRI